MKIPLFLLILLILLNSCQKSNETKTVDPDHLEIELNLVNDNKMRFVEHRFQYFPLYSFEKRSPNYHKKLFAAYKKDSVLKPLDSFSFTSFPFTQPAAFYYQSYKHKDIEEIKMKSDDTLGFTPSLKFFINAVSGFSGNNQIVIVDRDNNGSFDNDPVFEFPINFRSSHNNDPSIIDSLQVLEINYQIYVNGQISDFSRKVQIYPYTNNNHIYLLDENFLGNRLNNYTLMLNLKDYYKGILEIDTIKYNIAAQGWYGKTATVVIIPDSIKYDKNNLILQNDFTFTPGDTLSITNGFYRLDSVKRDLSKIFLNRIKRSTGKLTYRIGDRIDDVQIKDLEGNLNSLSSLIDPDKKMTLIDFWGTWCGPCIAALPELKEFQQNHQGDVNFLSVAYDHDPEQVKKFVKENKMYWAQAFVERDFKRKGSDIIKKFRINYFPTLVLIDQNSRIIYRGGALSTKEMEEILKNLNP